MTSKVAVSLLLVTIAWAANAPRSLAQTPPDFNYPLVPSQKQGSTVASTPFQKALRSYIRTNAVHSRSGQFVIHPANAPTGRKLAELKALDADSVLLSQPLISVSAERIRATVYQRLGLSGPWQGKVRIHIRAAESPMDRAHIETVIYNDGARYNLSLPNPTRRALYVRSLVQVVLSEYANRTLGIRSAEIPTWLIEGLTMDILFSKDDASVLDLAKLEVGSQVAGSWAPAFTDQKSTKEYLMSDSIKPSLVALQEANPLSFRDLSFSSPDNLPAVERALYQANAHIFLIQLLAVPNAEKAFQGWLSSLTTHWNWQTPFYVHFSPGFKSSEDVERWWAVTSAELMGRDESNAWSRDKTAHKIREVLHVSVSNTGSNEPAQSRLWVGDIIRDWDFFRQKTSLGATLNGLSNLRKVSHREMIPFVDAYRQTLQTYLSERQQRAPAFALKNRPMSPANQMTLFARRRLDSITKQMDDYLKQSLANEGLSPNEIR